MGWMGWMGWDQTPRITCTDLKELDPALFLRRSDPDVPCSLQLRPVGVLRLETI